MSVIKNIAILMVVGALLTVQACDIFSTRAPEEPRGAGSAFVPPTEPSITLQNLRTAISERNWANYLQCIVDTSDENYVFVPTLSAQSVYDFSRWDRASEGQYFRNLSAASSQEPSQLYFYEQDTSRSGFTFSFRAKYYLLFPHTRPQLSQVAQGRLEFSIELSPRNNLWYIVRWIDYPDTSQTTWSHFKGAFLN